MTVTNGKMQQTFCSSTQSPSETPLHRTTSKPHDIGKQTCKRRLTRRKRDSLRTIVTAGINFSQLAFYVRNGSRTSIAGVMAAFLCAGHQP